MNRVLSGLAIALVVVVLAVLATGAYTVDETKQVIITQFGKPLPKPVTEAGLHFKVPFLQQANYFEKRYLEWDGDPNQIPTRDKRYIYVDTFARWRIADPLVFFQRFGDERIAQSRLDDVLDGETRKVVAKHELIELIRTSNREFAISEELADATEVPPQETRFGREQLAQEVLAASAALTQDFGIELLDFRFKRINYVKAVKQEVYSRMTSERQRIAAQYRSQGEGEAARIQGERERRLKEITSEAYRLAAFVRARADAEAATIYAEAYGQDPEFYRFYQTLQTYREVIGGKTRLFLTTEGDLMHFLVNGK